MFDISGFEGNPFLENFLEYKFYHFLEGKTSFFFCDQKCCIPERQSILIIKIIETQQWVSFWAKSKQYIKKYNSKFISRINQFVTYWPYFIPSFLVFKSHRYCISIVIAADGN